MKLIRRCSLIVTFLMLFSVAGVAGSFSFVGNFINDNDVQLFSFTLLAPGTVTVQTWGYGGGTNAAALLIAAGASNRPSVSSMRSAALNSRTIRSRRYPLALPAM